MKKLIVFLSFLSLLTSCNVTETIIFTDDNSGEFLMSYDMGEMMSAMKDMAGESSDSENKKSKKVMDTTMVFADLMENYKDSIATLSEDKQLAFEVVKDMYMKMHMDEEKGIMNMGIGMKFESISELKDIQDKIKKAQSLNSQSGQADAMKENSPLGKLAGNENAKVAYDYSESGFTRTTTMPELSEEEYDEMNALFDDEDESDKEMMQYFEDSRYTVKLVFPKKVKSVNVEDAEISTDGKTVTYKVSWMDYIKNPKSLDVDVQFYE